jgi:hypothetical protein
MEETQEPAVNSLLTNSEPPEIGPLVTEIDKEAFFKSVISDKPFEDTISLFDGKLHITLKTMSVEENNDVVQQISNDRDNDLAENNDAYFITISMYRLALSLVSIDDKPFSDISKEEFKPKADEKGVTYIRARSDIMRNWPTFKLSAFLNAFNEFEQKVVKLTNEVKTQNFWKASA